MTRGQATPRGADLLVICVHYQNPDDTLGFARSVARQVGATPQLIVVDNSPEPPLALPPNALVHLPHSRVMSAGRNLGYFGAATFALRDHMTRRPLPDWVVVSNPDILLESDNVFNALITAHQGSEPAVLAPSIISTLSGLDQNPFLPERPSASRMHFYRWVFGYPITDFIYQALSGLKGQILRSGPASTPSRSAAQTIYAPHGSFLAFHRSYFAAGGTLDYRPFLFGEEIFVGETCRLLALPVLYEPGVRVFHREHRSTWTLSGRTSSVYRKESSRYLAQHYF